jgi:hypothetical protein
MERPVFSISIFDINVRQLSCETNNVIGLQNNFGTEPVSEIYSTLGLIVADISSRWLLVADPVFRTREVKVGIVVDKMR